MSDRSIIVGTDAEQAFQVMKRASGGSLQGNTVVDLESIPQGQAIVKRAETLQKAMQMKRAATMGGPGGMGTSVSRQAPKLFSPFWQISTLQLPSEIKQRNRWRRFYFQYDPFVGRALELHAKYPLSNFSLRVLDEPGIEEEYEEISEDLDLFNLLLWIAQEYWVVGEAFPFGLWDSDDLRWQKFVLMNPDYLTVEWDPLVLRDPITKIAEWSPSLRMIVNNGPADANTGGLYKRLMEEAGDVVQCIRNNKPYALHPVAVSQVARRANYFDIRGQSIIDRALRILMYQDKLMEANMAIADRHVNIKEFYMLGEAGSPAQPEELEAFQQCLSETWTSPLGAIIWNHALRVQMEGPAGKLLPTASEIQWIEQKLAEALQCSAALIQGGGVQYSTATVAEDIMISEYMTFRQQLEGWIKQRVFKQIAIARGYTKVSKKELSGHYRAPSNARRPIIPDVVWSKGVLRRDYQRIGVLVDLAGREKVPWGRVLESMGMDASSTFREIVREKKELADLGLTGQNVQIGRAHV